MKLLIVDDEPKILSAIKRDLKSLHLDITIETDAVRAQELVSNHTYDIVLTDYKMPVISGLDLLRYIKEVAPGTTAIMMTGFSGIDMLIKAINEQLVYKFIPKPWESEQLRDYIQEAMIHQQERHDQTFIQGEYLTDYDNLVRISKALKGRLADEATGQLSAFLRIMQVKDYALYKHSKNVAYLAKHFSAYLGLSENQQETAYTGGLLHDIGKIVIRDQIVYKKDSLDELEYQQMQTHPLIGGAIIKEIPSLSQVAKIIEQHHERIDGGGYPGGLKGHHILKEAAIVGLCDVYDSLVSERIYKEKLPHMEALDIIKSGRSGKFDPGLLSDFVDFLQENIIKKGSPY